MNKGKSKKRVLTRDYLVRATYNYLQRFATTEKNLAHVLDRKVRRRLSESDRDADCEPDCEPDYDERYAQAQEWITDIVQKAVQQNLVNDRQFSAARALSLARGGNSKRMIIQKLQAKGVPCHMVAEVMEDMAEQHQDMDLSAAVKYARKRRFGAFSSRHDGRDVVEKELASLCRAGFSYGLANRILKMTAEQLEDILYQARF